jgi:outer membrane protein assembly factor BamB
MSYFLLVKTPLIALYKSVMTNQLFSLGLLIGMACTLSADDWPRWRGAKFDDISPETALLKKWPSEGPRQLWINADVGLGYAGVSVFTGSLFTLGARDVTEYVIALDALTGKEKWSTEAGAIFMNDWGHGPRSTPTVDGDKVYALAGKGTLVCLQATDGKLLWNKELTSLGGTVPKWGYAESPLIHGQHVIVTPGGKQGTMVALDKLTGNLVWQSKDWTDDAQYSSAILVNHANKEQIIQLTMQHVAGLNPADGAVLWKASFPGKVAVIPTPIYSAGKVFVTAGYEVGCRLLDIGVAEPQQVYASQDLINHHGGVILHGDHLFGFSDRKGWTCMDFTSGVIKWQDKEKLKKGAIAAAGSQLYLLEEDSGTVALIDASTDGYHERGRFKLQPQSTLRSKQGKIWMHPVISNGKLYLRDQELLFCYDIAEK